MKVFALTFIVGISSGSETFFGLFSTKEKAEERAEKHAKEWGYAKHHYKIKEIEIDKEVNITLAEW